LPTLNLRHYKGQKQPYVAKILKTGAATQYQFLPKTASRTSSDKSYGMYQVTVDEEGFYVIGNAQDDENGHRLYYKTATGNKFPFVRKPTQQADITGRIANGESIAKIAQDLGFT